MTTTLHTDHDAALRFITCGSVDDGKSTLIGRLLVDSRAVLQDHLAGVSKGGQADLAQLTDGLTAEREQGITIDIAWRYFASAARKFIIGDAPGHEQYTRNMVTAASQADAAIVLVDATKLDWNNPQLQLLPQTRRHSLLAQLLRVPAIVFAINKLDAVDDPARAFTHIRAQLTTFAQEANIPVKAIIPLSALQGWNVVEPHTDWAGYSGPSLLQLLETLPNTPPDVSQPLAFPVQWVEKFSASSDTTQGRRIFWGRVASGSARVGDNVTIFPSGQQASIAQVIDHARQPGSVAANLSAGITLDREVDVSRGDWICAAPGPAPVRDITATIAWLDDEPLLAGRTYWALHGHRWVKAKVQRIIHRLNIHTLAEEAADQLDANAIGHVQLLLQQPLPAVAFANARVQGAMILVDTASHATAAAVLIH